MIYYTTKKKKNSSELYRASITTPSSAVAATPRPTVTAPAPPMTMGDSVGAGPQESSSGAGGFSPQGLPAGGPPAGPAGAAGASVGTATGTAAEETGAAALSEASGATGAPVGIAVAQGMS